jgi:hypothetical protein
MGKQASVGKGVRPARRSRPPVVEVTQSREHLQIWLNDSGARRLAGSIGVELASDARRLGQDLVDELIDDALREADRRSASNYAALRTTDGSG